MLSSLSALARICRRVYYRICCQSPQGKLKYLRKQGCVIGEGVRLYCNIDSFGTEPYLVEIGDNCVVSADVRFFTHDGGINVLNTLGYFGEKRMDKMGRIKVGNNAYIGTGAYIMPDVLIGDNCIVGAGSIVTKDVPDNTCVVGVPARAIGSIDDYFARCADRVYDSRNMSSAQKKRYLMEHVSPAGSRAQNN